MNTNNEHANTPPNVRRVNGNTKLKTGHAIGTVLGALTSGPNTHGLMLLRYYSLTINWTGDHHHYAGWLELHYPVSHPAVGPSSSVDPVSLLESDAVLEGLNEP